MSNAPHLPTAEEAGFLQPDVAHAYERGVLAAMQAASLLVGGFFAEEYVTARTSEVTELPNKRALEERLEALQARGEIGNYAYLCGDGRNFKLVNDTHGHRDGDGVLRETAYALIRGLRTVYNPSGLGKDEVFHISGDEFMALLYKDPGVAVDHEDVDGIRRRINITIEDLLQRDPRLQKLGYGLDIGVAYPDAHSTIKDLKAMAEVEMMKAKKQGHATHGQHNRQTGELERSNVGHAASDRRRSMIQRVYGQSKRDAAPTLDVRA